MLKVIRNQARRLVGRGFNVLGFDLVRQTRRPEHSMLGVRSLDVRTVIDVGANEGQFASQATTLFPQARIFSFEPVPAPFRALSSWAASTGGRVTAMNLALGDSAGEIEMFQHSNFTASSSLLATTSACEDLFPQTSKQERIRVRISTLDDALAGHDLARDVLVKLDVQGYEDRVIRGATRILSRASAVIVEVDVDPLYEGQASFKDLVASLDTCGLRFAGALEQIFGRDGHVIYFDAVFLRPKGGAAS